LTQGRIVVAHGRFARIRQVAPMCTLLIHVPTRVHIPNGRPTSIGSSVFTRLTIVTDRQTDRQTTMLRQ